jgi:hypothetical protein
LNLTPSAFVQCLLESDDPVWHRWDRDLPKLLNSLKDAARDEFSRESASNQDRYRVRLRRRRVLWLLDRLAPQSDGNIFEPYLDSPRALYSWGRRLPRERRHELIRPNAAHGMDRIRPLQAAMLAWCDSCPDDELDCLLDWTQHWAPVLVSHDLAWLPHPEVEFWKKYPDRRAGRERLNAALRSHGSLSNGPEGILGDAGRTAARKILRLLLEDVATQHPGADGPCRTREQWLSWLDRTIESPPFAHLAEFVKDTQFNSEYTAQSFWIWRHGADQWKQLCEYVLCEPEKRAFDRLAAIVPRDELPYWDFLVLDQARNDGVIEAYCEWLAPEYAEVLRTHFAHPDSDWRACAYQN